jgi:hypothetical protein
MNSLHSYTLILTLLSSLSLFAKKTDVSYDQQWLNLYRYTEVGKNNDSLVTNQNWFFHPQGRQFPEKEFHAAIEKLKEDPKSRCLFPARTLYLKRKGFLPENLDPCPDYEYFKRKVRLQSVWLVFASYYVNNPSSAFGHTLFKLQGKGNNNDLLEYGVNFAAQMTTQNPFLYALFGLTGGFKGNFSLLPYFIKIAEYNDSETRDLWEYRLNLTEKEKEMFLAHLWEMDKAKFDYYYLTENCSYHLLLFLDAIRPTLSFKEKMPYFVLPSETLTLVNEAKSLVDKKKVRPSQFKKTQERYNNLSPSSKKGVAKLSKREQADLLDYQIDHMDLTRGKQLFQKVPAVVKEKRKLQAARARLSQQAPKKLEIATGDSPHLIHPSHFLALGHGLQNFSRPGQDISLERTLFTYRFSFHEYLDPQVGAPSWSQLMLGKVEAAYNHDQKRLELSQFTLFKTEANQENIDNSGALSWGLEVGARNNPFTFAYDVGPYIKSIVGINFRLGRSLIRFVTPFEIDYSRPKIRDHALKAQLSTMIQWLSPLTNSWRLVTGLGANYASFRPGKTEFIAEFGTQVELSKEMALRLKGFFLDKDVNSQALLLFYF